MLGFFLSLAIAVNPTGQDIKSSSVKIAKPNATKSESPKENPSDGLRDAMLGLKWGWSPKDVKLSGAIIELKECNMTTCTYSLKKPLKTLSWAEGYSLIFGNDSLYKIRVYSVDITDDPYGTAGKSLFGTIDSTLSIKYRTKGSFMYTGRELYEEGNEFYQCLGYNGCGSWAKFFSDSGKSIVLELKPLGKGLNRSGYISMETEASPEWSDYLDMVKTKTKGIDSDAL